MASRLVTALQRANRPHGVEESLAVRVLVLMTVLVAVAAVGAVGAAPWADTLFALVFLPIGAWVSHRRKGQANFALKTVLAAAAVAALIRFVGDLSVTATFEDTRQPLAQLFLAVQVIHGFDLPARRDLGFTVASSLALLALAGAASSTFVVAPFLVAWLVLVAASLVALERSAVAEEAAGRRREQGRQAPQRVVSAHGGGAGVPLWPGVRLAGSAVLAGLLLFSILPQPQRTHLGGLPFSGFPGAETGGGGVVNPGLPYGGRQAGDGDFNPEAYFGFAEYVDLRAAGDLSDTVVMRVRADRPAPWRGMVFDTYDGSSWTRSADADEARTYQGIPAVIEDDQPRRARTVQAVQTFELVADTPNLVFAAAEPSAVYLAAGSIQRWPDGTISTFGLQQAGTVYSVVSRASSASPAQLRTAAGTTEGLSPAERARFLQLPGGLPARVRTLSRDLVAGASTNYERAEAIQDWLGANTEYVLGVPPPPAGGDVVDRFLFDTREGWCEPIASSMVVLLRAAEVPARFVTGFQPGARNPLTGWHTVRMNQAHAWVEAWVPGYGWIAFDPTGAVPLGQEPPTVRVPLIDLVRRAVAALVGAVPAPVVRLGEAAVAALARSWPLTLATAVLGGVALTLIAAARVRLRRRRAGPYAAVEALLAGQGVPRQPWQTPREFVELARSRCPGLPPVSVDTVLAWEEARRYGGRAWAGPPRAQADAAVSEIRKALRRPVGTGSSTRR